jgi:hypothetical protein
MVAPQLVIHLLAWPNFEDSEILVVPFPHLEVWWRCPSKQEDTTHRSGERPEPRLYSYRTILLPIQYVCYVKNKR